MKKNPLMYYIAVLFLLSTVLMFAQTPGSNDDTGNLEGSDPPAAPIDNYVWFFMVLGIVFTFYKFKTLQKNREVNN
jgi:hypothetical protein